MTRLSFPYFMSREAVDYITQAIAMVARDGWRLLPDVSVRYYDSKLMLIDVWDGFGYTPKLNFHSMLETATVMKYSCHAGQKG